MEGDIYFAIWTNIVLQLRQIHFAKQIHLLSGKLGGCDRGSHQECNEREIYFCNLDKHLLQSEQIHFATQTNTVCFFFIFALLSGGLGYD